MNAQTYTVVAFLPGQGAFRSPNRAEPDGWSTCGKPHYQTHPLGKSVADRAAKALRRCGYVVRVLPFTAS